MIAKFIVLWMLAGILYGCTTEKPNDASFPCKVCKPHYNTTCTGIRAKDINSCATAKQAKVEYFLGLPPKSKRGFIPPGVCTMNVKCPAGTKMFHPIEQLGQNPVAWCEESGSEAGKWYAGTSWLLRYQIERVADACRDPAWKL